METAKNWPFSLRQVVPCTIDQVVGDVTLFVSDGGRTLR